VRNIKQYWLTKIIFRTYFFIIQIYNVVLNTIKSNYYVILVNDNNSIEKYKNFKHKIFFLNKNLIKKYLNFYKKFKICEFFFLSKTT